MGMPTQLAQSDRRRSRRLRRLKRQTLEELPSIDCRWLSRRKMWPKGHYTTRHGLIAFNRAISWIELSPRAAKFTFVNGSTQVISVTWLRTVGAFQSVRPAFQCPD